LIVFKKFKTQKPFKEGYLGRLDLLHKSEKLLPSPPRNGEGARFLPPFLRQGEFIVSTEN
jgi:hypothetical protein